jgi:enoyl-[acyl-carrier protein] reductase/trans-2-enoyl-CoA reductase (NAD+)
VGLFASLNIQKGVSKIIQDEITNSPKKVLVIGASTGYGLASHIVASFGCKADTIGVCSERPEMEGKPASARFYNARLG